jgi:hypothetical protein
MPSNCSRLPDRRGVRPDEPVVDAARPADPTVEALRSEPNPLKRFLRILGPGLVTGASDDDPSGIGTYAQAGAQFGYATLWTTVAMLPMMSAIQHSRRSAWSMDVAWLAFYANTTPAAYSIDRALDGHGEYAQRRGVMGAIAAALHLVPIPGSFSSFRSTWGSAWCILGSYRLPERIFR